MKHTGRDKEQWNLQNAKISFTPEEMMKNHREGVGILMSKHAAESLMEWTPINERVIQARFSSRYIKLTIIYKYAPTEDAGEVIKD